MGKALGIKHMAMPTTATPARPLAAYATSCGIKTTIFCPADTPRSMSRDRAAGRDVYRVTA